MKKYFSLLFLLIYFIVFTNCDKENSLEKENMKLAEGTWHGDFGDHKVVLCCLSIILHQQYLRSKVIH